MMPRRAAPRARGARVPRGQLARPRPRIVSLSAHRAWSEVAKARVFRAGAEGLGPGVCL